MSEAIYVPDLENNHKHSQCQQDVNLSEDDHSSTVFGVLQLLLLILHLGSPFMLQGTLNIWTKQGASVWR